MVKKNAIILGILVLMAVLVIGVVLISRYGKSTKELTKENFPSWEKINQFIYGGWDFKLLGETEETATRGTEDELIKNLGAPLSSKVERVDRYGTEIEIKEWFYDGLYIRSLRALESEILYLTDLSITSDKYKMKWGLKVGASKARVKEVLGKPFEEKDNVWIYQYINGGRSYVRFYFKDDIINKIEFEFFVA